MAMLEVSERLLIVFSVFSCHSWLCKKKHMWPVCMKNSVYIWKAASLIFSLFVQSSMVLLRGQQLAKEKRVLTRFLRRNSTTIVCVE